MKSFSSRKCPCKKTIFMKLSDLHYKGDVYNSLLISWEFEALTYLASQGGPDSPGCLSLALLSRTIGRYCTLMPSLKELFSCILDLNWSHLLSQTRSEPSNELMFNFGPLDTYICVTTFSDILQSFWSSWIHFPPQFASMKIANQIQWQYPIWRWMQEKWIIKRHREWFQSWHSPLSWVNIKKWKYANFKFRNSNIISSFCWSNVLMKNRSSLAPYLLLGSMIFHYRLLFSIRVWWKWRHTVSRIPPSLNFPSTLILETNEKLYSKLIRDWWSAQRFRNVRNE